MADAVRFCQFFANEIEEHPLLVYHSALPFTPTTSIIYQTFHSARYMRVAGVQPHWSPNVQTFQFSGEEYVRVVVFSRDGTLLAAAGDRSIQVWIIASGSRILRIPLTDSPHSLAFTTDGSRLFLGDALGNLRGWDVTSGDSVYSVQAHSSAIRQIDIIPSANDDLIATVGGGRLRFARSDGTTIVPLLVSQSQDVARFGLSSNGRKLATLHFDLSIRLWVMPGGLGDGVLGCAEGKNIGPNDHSGIHFAHSDTRVVFHAEGWIHIWDVESKTCLRSYHQQSTATIAISPCTDHLFVGGHFGTDFIQILTDAREHHASSLKGHWNAVQSLAISPDGRMLASGSADYTVRLWSMIDAVRVPSVSFGDSVGEIDEATISLDAKWIAAASESNDKKLIHFWDAEKAQRRSTHSPFPIPSEWDRRHPKSIRFSTDGQNIGLRYGDQTAAWEIATGTEVPAEQYINDFNWDEGGLGKWGREKASWVKQSGRHVTKLPFLGFLKGGRGLTAMVQDFGTKHLYVLHLPD